MHAIVVVALHHIEDDIDDVAARFGLAGVEPELAGVTAHPFGMRLAHVIRGRVGGGARGHAEGIEPCVQFDAARVGFGDREGQRIVARRDALFSAQERGPGLAFRGVKRIRGGANLAQAGWH